MNDTYCNTKKSFNTFETALTVAIIVVAIVCVGGAVVAVA